MPIGESYVSENQISLNPASSIKSLSRAATRTDTRNALVWCGTELLTERGFQITGIDEVLKRAVIRMLPKNKLQSRMMANLQITQ